MKRSTRLLQLQSDAAIKDQDQVCMFVKDTDIKEDLERE